MNHAQPRPSLLARVRRRLHDLRTPRIDLQTELDALASQAKTLQQELEFVIAELASMRIATDRSAAMLAGVDRVQVAATLGREPVVATLAGPLSCEELAGELRWMRLRTLQTGNNALFEIFTAVTDQRDRWERCDVILACPATARGALELFPDTTVHTITDVRTISDTLRTGTVPTIGIVSPWLLDEFISAPTQLAWVLQRCGREVLAIDGHTTGAAHAATRATLHIAGAAEIAFAEGAGLVEHTVATTSDGQFEYLGAEISFAARQPRWSTMVASLAGFGPGVPHPWVNRGVARVGMQQAIVALPGAVGFATTGDRHPVAGVRVTGTAEWRRDADGHVALVASHAGPGDYDAYIGLLHVADGYCSVSLRRSGAPWTLLESAVFDPALAGTTNGQSRLPFWLEITGSDVRIGTEERTLLSATDTELARVASYGVRVAGRDIWLTDITHEYREL